MSATPDRLRAATERLLRVRPASQVTLRDITNEAGANVAAVGYHFGSKDALVVEVLEAAVATTARVGRDALDALPADAGLQDVLLAWLGSGQQSIDGAHNDGGDEGDTAWSLLRCQLGDSDPAVGRALGGAMADIGRELTDRLRPHLPHLSDDEITLRHRAVVATLGGLTTLGHEPLDDPATAAQILTFLMGGLTAPATTPHP